MTLKNFLIAAGLRDEWRARSKSTSESFTSQFSHFKVKLQNRKNWQKRMKNGEQQTRG